MEKEKKNEKMFTFIFISLFISFILNSTIVFSEEKCSSNGILKFNSNDFIKFDCNEVYIIKKADLIINNTCDFLELYQNIKPKSWRSYNDCTEYSLNFSKPNPTVIRFHCEDEFTVPIHCKINNSFKKIPVQVTAMNKFNFISAFPDITCGNNFCESKYGENFEICPEDCPSCEDNNKCTKDHFDYKSQKCKNDLLSDCCGNDVCEIGEYTICIKDCPNCDDNDKCTKDNFDFKEQRCKNEFIGNCCGNNICDDGEDYKSCKEDCNKNILFYRDWLLRLIWYFLTPILILIIIVTIGRVIYKRLKYDIPFKESWKEIKKALKKKIKSISLIK